MCASEGTAGECQPCEEALELDRIALVRVDNAEIGVIACLGHLRRVALALEQLEALEKYLPPLPDLPAETFDARVRVVPGVTPS